MRSLQEWKSGRVEEPAPTLPLFRSSTLLRLTEWGAEELTGAGIDQGRLEAQLLLAHSLSTTRLDILSCPDREIDAEARQRFVELVERRRSRVPLAYLRGTQEFYGLEFTVTPDVLIPRPETELLVDLAREVAGTESAVIWDVGTGAGCIAVACAMNIPAARVFASDLSEAALAVAGRNVRRHGVEGRCHLVQADLLTTTRPVEVTIILANPPYISQGEIAGLQPEVRDFEPRLALHAGEDGLAVHRRLIPQAFGALKPSGWLAVEVAMGQAEAVGELFDAAGFHDVGIRKDLAGVQRVVLGQKP